MNKRQTLSEQQVIEILQRLKNKELQKDIALFYGVHPKTISRIKTGKNWQWLSQQVLHPEEVLLKLAPIFDTKQYDEQYLTSLDQIVAIKNTFCLDHNKPIYWGWFDGWDGKHAIATDGIIAWESNDLVNYFKNLDNTLNKNAKELPTIALEILFNYPLNTRANIVDEYKNSIKLSGDSKIVFIDKKFAALVNKLSLEYFFAGNTNLVYLVKTKKRTDTPAIIACIAPME